MQSEQIGELAKALAKAQGEIKGAVKGKENPYFHSQYADLPAIMGACREALSANGIAVVQATEFSVLGTEDMRPTIWIETMLLHSSGQWKSGRYPVRPTKDDPQGLGSAMTYARRYALAAMVGVVAENEDDDGNVASGKDAVPPKDISRTRTTGPLPKPSDESAKKAAIKFAQDACVDLEGLTLKEQLTAWMHVNKSKVDRLKEYDQDLADTVNAAIVDANSRVK